jgi:1-deoxy-D-xylulose-5-phosphate synthase
MISGGFGTGVLEYASSRNYSGMIVTLGIKDEFVEQSSRRRQIERYGLDAASIAETVRKAIRR